MQYFLHKEMSNYQTRSTVKNSFKTILTATGLVQALKIQGRLDVALNYADTIIAKCVKAQKNKQTMAWAYGARHSVLLSMGRWDEVEHASMPLLECFDANSMGRQDILMRQGSALHHNRKLFQAEKVLREGLRISEKISGAKTAVSIFWVCMLARCQHDQGEKKEALNFHKRARAFADTKLKNELKNIVWREIRKLEELLFRQQSGS